MNKLNIKLNIALLFITIFLALIQVLLLNSFSTVGDQLTEYTNKIESIQKENANLSQVIASVSAMQTISSRAEKLDLKVIIPLFSINAPIPVAFNYGPSM